MLKWSFNACFAHCSYVRNKKTHEIWVLCTFCAPIELFFGGTALVSVSACSFFEPNFFKNHEPCAHDAHIIFLSPEGNCESSTREGPLDSLSILLLCR